MHMSVVDRTPQSLAEDEQCLAEHGDPRVAQHVWHDWCAHAVALPGKALHLAMMLSVLGRRASSAGVRPTRRMMRAWSISRDACYDGLERLESAGLVYVWRLPGRTPMVIMVDPSTKKPLRAIRQGSYRQA
jgi:hypothetical protein